MNASFRRRAVIRGITFLIAGILVMGGFIFANYQRAQRYQQYLALSGQHAFAELTTAITELDTALQKGLYSTTSPMLCSICSEIYAKTQMAQMALGDLPYANVELEQTASFLAKVGDYAAALSRNAARDGGLTQEERDNLQGLSSATTALSQSINEIQVQLTEGTLNLESLEMATRRLASAAQDGEAAQADTVFQTMEEEFPEVPTLIYDGPFSQHLAQRTPLGLEGLEQVTQQQAQQAAADFLGVRPEIFSLVSVSEGALPTYSFTASMDGGEVYVEVTRQGGKVLELFTSRAMGQETLSFDEAVAAADTFLSAQGFESMRASYYIDQEGLLTIHYASVQDGVYCYPDLIKVSVALDTGKIVGFEGAGYYWNHTPRELPAPVITQAEAERRISPLLQILSVQQAVIPTSGQYEVSCYEFKCQNADGQHYLVYLHISTGLEERILILIEDESGTLAM